MDDLKNCGLLIMISLFLLSDNDMTSIDGFSKEKITGTVDFSKVENVVEKNNYMMIKDHCQRRLGRLGKRH
jgi:hypothetical protein